MDMKIDHLTVKLTKGHCDKDYKEKELRMRSAQRNGTELNIIFFSKPYKEYNLTCLTTSCSILRSVATV
jgi:hypothetical protein